MSITTSNTGQTNYSAVWSNYPQELNRLITLEDTAKEKSGTISSVFNRQVKGMVDLFEGQASSLVGRGMNITREINENGVKIKKLNNDIAYLESEYKVENGDSETTKKAKQLKKELVQPSHNIAILALQNLVKQHEAINVPLQEKFNDVQKTHEHITQDLLPRVKKLLPELKSRSSFCDKISGKVVGLGATAVAIIGFAAKLAFFSAATNVDK